MSAKTSYQRVTPMNQTVARMTLLHSLRRSFGYSQTTRYECSTDNSTNSVIGGSADNNQAVRMIFESDIILPAVVQKNLKFLYQRFSMAKNTTAPRRVPKQVEDSAGRSPSGVSRNSLVFTPIVRPAYDPWTILKRETGVNDALENLLRKCNGSPERFFDLGTRKLSVGPNIGEIIFFLDSLTDQTVHVRACIYYCWLVYHEFLKLFPVSNSRQGAAARKPIKATRDAIADFLESLWPNDPRFRLRTLEKIDESVAFGKRMGHFVSIWGPGCLFIFAQADLNRHQDELSLKKHVPL
ncbi:hypothetical protein EJ05DRAFT_232085 [Pseudovirgaria hyperparasitica]|uniref:Uncharacterized protein n=1 Tax=Pseudovirgaria hyperparasitica TaxID=470096 RepID=A0A6A6VUP1_9PEZI|nr:uncharacterized protein EJ05DRAFT_232085 [Pseudovirgaria hyperparasitica]KAF2752961.1 hypothetical protein EJ05DRAFT_232085 [Pseudovirgaria hyperparasitica]